VYSRGIKPTDVSKQGAGMLKLRHLIFTLALASLIGCTPVDESVIKKAASASAGDIPGAVNAGRAMEAPAKPELDPEMRAFLKEFGPMVRRQASAYGLDWRLILAMVKQESRFTEDALSHKGASGLMQIMPTTGEELAARLSLRDLQHPENNIRGGVYYLRSLYDFFRKADETDRIKLALAAYNAGIRRVYDAQDIAAYLDENPQSWDAVRDAFPLLSKRYYTLHRSIWPGEKPRSGWFGNSRETVAYVDNVIHYYEELRVTLN
jgi:membrane-bound lytic murein transglycosylase MltF